jgi:hypothetical protein
MLKIIWFCFSRAFRLISASLNEHAQRTGKIGF